MRYEVARRANTAPSSVELVPDEESLQNAINRILAYDSRKVIRAMAPSNIAAGEPVHVSYHVYESALVFVRGEHLLSRIVREKPDSAQAEVVLSYILREVNRMSQASGILNDPLTGTVGGIPANDFYDGVDRIAAAKIEVQGEVKDIDPYEEQLPPLQELTAQTPAAGTQRPAADSPATAGAK